ncbi:hypothetical protein [Streptomyces sp. NBC_01462]|uniref:hypothetical protein n=1 Tax=Streptomyces sp. NBC_01462 TaxID=2903876 RepID=UPI002E2FE3EA|nr:hypothetical protein [Streptomyces sp. NBC_01462]
MTLGKTQTDRAALCRGRLEAFVVRARRVEAHSLAADWDALVTLADAPYTVTARGNGEAHVRQEYPAEEVVESAAARVRPLLLEGDACSYLKALAAVGYFCRNRPHDTQWVKAARAEWRTRTDPNAPREGGYQVMIGDDAEGWTAELDDRKLATAWIYGDVVHHDTDLLEEADPFGLSERFRAAVPLVASVMVMAIELLNYIRALHTDSLLGLPAELFEREVVLTSTCWEQVMRVFAAPVGTPAPADALSPFSEH